MAYLTDFFKYRDRRSKKTVLIISGNGVHDESFLVEMKKVSENSTEKRMEYSRRSHRGEMRAEEGEWSLVLHHHHEFSISDDQVDRFCQIYNSSSFRESGENESYALDRIIFYICGNIKVYYCENDDLIKSHHYCVIVDFGNAFKRNVVYMVHLTCVMLIFVKKIRGKKISSKDWRDIRNTFNYKLLYSSKPYQREISFEDIHSFSNQYEISKTATCQDFAKAVVTNFTGEDLKCQIDGALGGAKIGLAGGIVGGVAGGVLLGGFVSFGAGMLLLGGAGVMIGGAIGYGLNESRNRKAFENTVIEVTSETIFNLYLLYRPNKKEKLQSYILVIDGENEGYLTILDLVGTKQQNNNNVIVTPRCRFEIADVVLKKIFDEGWGSIGLDWGNEINEVEGRSITFSRLSKNPNFGSVKLNSLCSNNNQQQKQNVVTEENLQRFCKNFFKNFLVLMTGEDIDDVFFEEKNIHYPQK